MRLSSRPASLALLVGLSVVARQVKAQAALDDLPVQVTVGLSIANYGNPPATEGWGVDVTWTGRLAVRSSGSLYFGIAGNPWSQRVGNISNGQTSSDTLVSIAEASVLTAYGQYYPLHQSIGFIRAGIGIGLTSTVAPAGLYMFSENNTRFAWTIGGGADVKLHRPVYLTFSIDYTGLAGVPDGFGLDHSFALSVGVTLR